MEDSINVDCPFCEVRMAAPVQAAVVEHIEGANSPIDCRIALTKCLECGSALVVRQHQRDVDYDHWEWSVAVRVWPEPARSSHATIPPIVQVSLDEADRCHRAGAHTACAVMCGRALEGVCVDKGVKSTLLAKGLKELRDSGLIDQRLFEWGDALREVRNLAAHATGEKIGKADSTDLLQFVTAICDYIYVLTARFDAFKERRQLAKAATLGDNAPVPDDTLEQPTG